MSVLSVKLLFIKHEDGVILKIEVFLRHCHVKTRDTVQLKQTLMSNSLILKVKFSSIHYWVLGQEVIPVYRQSARRWQSHPSGGRLPLLSVRPAVTFPTEERHHPSAGTRLYCLVTEAHACDQLAQGCYLEADQSRFEPVAFWIMSEHSTIMPHRPLV